MIIVMALLSDRKSGLLVFMAVFTTLAVTKTKQQDSFYFDPSPINQDVVDGLDALLRCDVSNRRQIQFYWTLNGRQLANTSRRYQDGTNLRILRVDRLQDSGSFRCIATNVTTGIALRSTEAKLNISWINSTASVELSKPDTAGEISEGVEINLRCHANGNPDPSIEWYRNRIRLFGSNRIRIAKNKTRIIGVSSSDNGVYSCRATNTGGSVNSVDNFLLSVPGADVPTLDLVTFTKSLLVREGDRVTFNCRYSNNAASTEWYFGQKRVTNDVKYSVLDIGALVISHVDAADAGIYNCVGLSSKGASQTYAAELHLAYLNDLTDDSFEPKPTIPQVIPLGGKLEIRCLTPRGNPAPTQRWEDPYSVEIGDQGRVKSTDGGLLVISAADETDTGNYTCRVANLDGVRSKSIWVVVSVPPRLKSPPLSNRKTEGESVNFDCAVIGTPFPVTVVTWMKDEQPLDTSGSGRIGVDGASGTLRISGIVMADEGNYACTVNTVGHGPIVSSYAHLYVEKSLKFKPMLLNQKLELGSNATIRCRADGLVVPRVRWSKPGQSELPSHVRDVDGTLHFTKVDASDAGEYVCVASSDQGVINVTVRVDVVVRPKFKVKPVNTTAYEGRPTMLHCVAIGDPEPAVQWDKNNKILVVDETEQRLKILANGSLQIAVAYMEDGGKYGCTAGNSGGLEREEVFLQVASGDSYMRLNDGAAGADNFNMMKTIVIAVCSAVAYLAIVIGLTVYCSIRLMRAKNQRKQRHSEITANGTEKGENGHIALETTELVDKSKESMMGKSDLDAFSMSVSGSHNSHSTHSRTSQRNNYDKWAFPRKDLETLGMLGKGFYGDVFLAKAYGLNGGQPDRLVVVKSLMSRGELHLSEFYHEVEVLSRVNHEHVARLVGVCREVEPMFMLTEYCEWGDLKQFLLTIRKEMSAASQTAGGSTLNGSFTPSIRLPTMTVAQQLNMCHQVSIGMEQLANQRLVHRDLAARNILLTPNLDVKVACLGLSRDVYAAEYVTWRNRLVPVRWTAPEVFADAAMTSPEIIGDAAESMYTSSSDSFSFGVFVWELFTLAELPLRHLSDEDVVRCRKQHGGGPATRLSFPPSCPLDLWHLVERCQADFPGDRPTFAELSAEVGEMIASILV